MGALPCLKVMIAHQVLDMRERTLGPDHLEVAAQDDWAVCRGGAALQALNCHQREGSGACASSGVRSFTLPEPRACRSQVLALCCQKAA